MFAVRRPKLFAEALLTWHSTIYRPDPDVREGRYASHGRCEVYRIAERDSIQRRRASAIASGHARLTHECASSDREELLSVRVGLEPAYSGRWPLYTTLLT